MEHFTGFINNFGHFAFAVFWFLVMLSVVVFIHEFGHYIVARWCGVKIEVFALGFGKELYGRNDKHGTRWKICLLPFGGYVKMFGDNDAASTPDFKSLTKLTKQEKKVSFYFKKVWQKFAIVFAGPLFNYVLAVFIIWGMFFTYGKVTTVSEITVIQEGGAADKAGIKLHDRVLAVDGTDIENFEDLSREIMITTGQPLQFKILRGEKVIEITAAPEIKKRKDAFGNDVELPVLGVAGNKREYHKIDFIPALGEAVKETYNISAAILKTVGQMIVGSRGLEQLGGPVKIAQYSGQTAALGAQAYLWFIAMISINLGLVNLLPIPMLDGGHLLFYIIEGIIGKRIPKRVQEYSFRAGFLFIMAIMFVAIYNDFASLIR
jgi:regulator of sigma E protease